MINRTDFILLAGQPDKQDAETVTRMKQGEYLTDIQEDQHRRGKREAELQRSMYGWTVRSGNGLDGFAIMYTPGQSRPDKGFAEALMWGRAWANQRPEDREFYIRRFMLAHYPDETASLSAELSAD